MFSRLVLVTLFLAMFYTRIGVSEPVPVVIVLCAAEEGIVLQLKAELDTVGYQPVLIISPEKSLTPLETDKILETHDAIALINITNEERGVEVWVSSGTVGGGKLVETVGDPRQPISVATILKSVESLRASLMQFDTMKSQTESPPPKTDTPKMEKVKPKTASTLSTWSFEVGLSSQHGFGKFYPPLHLHFSFVWWLNERLALFGTPIFPIFPMKADNSQGEASVFEGQLLLGVRQYLTVRTSRYRPFLGIGIGPSLMRIIGKAEDGWRSSEDTLLLALLSAQAGLSVTLTERIGFQAVCFSSFSMFLRPIVVLGEKQLPTENPVVIGGRLSLTIVLF